jgi:hypothetical protein
VGPLLEVLVGLLARPCAGAVGPGLAVELALERGIRGRRGVGEARGRLVAVRGRRRVEAHARAAERGERRVPDAAVADVVDRADGLLGIVTDEQVAIGFESEGGHARIAGVVGLDPAARHVQHVDVVQAALVVGRGVDPALGRVGDDRGDEAARDRGEPRDRNGDRAEAREVQAGDRVALGQVERAVEVGERGGLGRREADGRERPGAVRVREALDGGGLLGGEVEAAGTERHAFHAIVRQRDDLRGVVDGVVPRVVVQPPDAAEVRGAVADVEAVAALVVCEAGRRDRPSVRILARPAPLAVDQRGRRGRLVDAADAAGGVGDPQRAVLRRADQAHRLGDAVAVGARVDPRGGGAGRSGEEEAGGASGEDGGQRAADARRRAGRAGVGYAHARSGVSGSGHGAIVVRLSWCDMSLRCRTALHKLASPGARGGVGPPNHDRPAGPGGRVKRDMWPAA